MKNNILEHIFFLILISSLLVGCTTSQSIKPIGRGNQTVEIIFGGPLLQTPVPYIVPLLSFNYTKGVTEKLNLFTSFQITEAIFNLAHFDFGASYELVDNKTYSFISGISHAFHLQVLKGLNGGTAKVYPELEISGYWDYGKNSYFYTGLSSFIELSRYGADGIKQPHNFILSPFIGTKLGFQKINLTFELKWLALNIKTREALPVEYINLGAQGAPAPRIAISWKY